MEVEMKQNNRIYAAIDLKSFYASVECIERGLDPLTTNLVVRDLAFTHQLLIFYHIFAIEWQHL